MYKHIHRVKATVVYMELSYDPSQTPLDVSSGTYVLEPIFLGKKHAIDFCSGKSLLGRLTVQIALFLQCCPPCSRRFEEQIDLQKQHNLWLGVNLIIIGFSLTQLVRALTK